MFSTAVAATTLDPYLGAEVSYRREQLYAAAASVSTGRRTRRRARRSAPNSSAN